MGTQSGFGAANQSFSINGARAANMGVTLDGANMRDIGNNGGSMNVPNNEFVAEVKVQMSNYAAEFGTAAINVQAVTRSGSSEFHGSAYDYLRAPQVLGQRPGPQLRGPGPPGDEVPVSRLHPLRSRSSSPAPASTRTGTRRSSSSATSGSARRWPRTRSAAWCRPRGCARALFNDFGAGQHLNLNTTVNIPSGFPGAGTPAPTAT